MAVAVGRSRVGELGLERRVVGDTVARQHGRAAEEATGHDGKLRVDHVIGQGRPFGKATGALRSTVKMSGNRNSAMPDASPALQGVPSRPLSARRWSAKSPCYCLRS